MSEKYKFTKANVNATTEAVYRYIVQFFDEYSYAPTVRDICRGVGLRSTSTVHGHLKRLAADGRIEVIEGKRRAIQLVSQGVLDASNSSAVPLVGTVTAGTPILATENITGSISIPSGTYQNTDNMFALKVKGDSMINAAILDGDIVLVKKQAYADAGDIIVALIDDEATVKTLANNKDGYYLQPQNDAYNPIKFNTENCSILGIVVGLMRFSV